MLRELSIRNFAIIEQLSITFEEGLTVLTGETGAGKSIVIDALHLLTGARASTDFVRFGEKKAVIEGLFFAYNESFWKDKLEANDIPVEEDMIILRREILATGKSVCKVNGKLVSLTILKDIGQHLIDIHGQHDTHSLLDSATHQSLLDAFIGEDIKIPLNKYKGMLEKFHDNQRQLERLLDQDRELYRHHDIIQFQRTEIMEANLNVEEERDLIEERKKALQFERSFSTLKKITEALSGDQGVMDNLNHAKQLLLSLTTLDGEYEKLYETLDTNYYAIEDVAFTLSSQLTDSHFDEGRLTYIEERLNIYARLKRKYGTTVEEILIFLDKLNKQWEQLENLDFYLSKLKREIKEQNQALKKLSESLYKLRESKASHLIEGIHQQLKDLYMDKAKFDIQIKLEEKSISLGDETIEGYNYRSHGAEVIEFHISTNPGEPFKSLAKIASGGELSRIMLAIKAIFNGELGMTSIIFDEVDTGVSGRVAQAMANKMRTIAKTSQVLAITHLPQVATIANTHFLISKHQHKDYTEASIDLLSEEQRVIEISRMISGNDYTEATKEHVRNMLKTV